MNLKVYYMLNQEELAKKLFQSVDILPQPYLYLAEVSADAGEWGQVAASVISGALKADKIPDLSLLQEALDLWGRDELGILVDKASAVWLTT